MRALKVAGMVVGSPVAMLGFLLPVYGVGAVVGAVVGASHGFIIIIGH